MQHSTDSVREEISLLYHPLIGGHISQYSASARPPHRHLCPIWVLWPLPRRHLVSGYASRYSRGSLARIRSPHYVRPRIQAFAISSRVPCQSVSFHCSLGQSERALPPEKLYDKAQVCSRPCQDPKLNEESENARVEDAHTECHTISPRSRTFSPRTRNIPRKTSA